MPLTCGFTLRGPIFIKNILVDSNGSIAAKLKTLGLRVALGQRPTAKTYPLRPCNYLSNPVELSPFTRRLALLFRHIWGSFFHIRASGHVIGARLEDTLIQDI